MKVLVIVTRFPAPHTKGDQSRAFSWVVALSKRHEVTVATPAAAEDRAWRDVLERHARLVDLPGSPLRRAAGALGCLMRGRPGQTGWMMPTSAWRRVRALACDHDAVLAMTVRSLRGPLGRPVVLDHVDALSLNMTRRAHGPESVVVRLAARIEAPLLRRWEARCASWARCQVATSHEDADALPPPPATVLPVSSDCAPFDEPPGHVRDIDLVFTGNMRYPPNRRGAALLANEILPLVRARLPVRAMLVGRAADTIKAPGIEVASDVESVSEYLQRARVAVAPLEGGTGTPTKVLEAAVAGAAVVAVPWASDRFGINAATAETPAEFAARIVELLADEPRRAAQARAAANDVLAHLTARVAGRLEELLCEACRPATCSNASTARRS